MLIRHDWSKRSLIIVVVLVVIIIICSVTDVVHNLYDQANTELQAVATVVTTFVQDGVLDEEAARIATSGRLMGNWRIHTVRAFGYGYEYAGPVASELPHNIVLVAIEQSGIPAAIAWLVMVFFVGFKQKRWYLMTGLLALGMFDHLLWGQLGTWVIIGVGMMSKPHTDLIWRTT
jgi:hypothetical protein